MNRNLDQLAVCADSRYLWAFPFLGRSNRRRISVAGSMCLLVVALVLISVSGDAAAQKGGKEKLPDYWSMLDLSADQKEKALKIVGDYSAKIEQLNKQIKQLQTEERKELAKVLTETQKEKLRKIAIEKTGIDPFGPPKKEVDPQKEKGNS